MAIALEIRERQKNHLLSLLTIKALNSGVVHGLLEEIKRAITPMDQEDIAWVEKIAGVRAID
jgi:hypothetical protein